MPRRFALLLCTAACVLSGATGCRAPLPGPIHSPDYAQLARALAASRSGGGFAEPVTPPVVELLAGPHEVEELVAYALAQNPAIQAARSRVAAAAARVPQEASLEDPMLSVTTWPFFPHTPQTASGRMTVDLMVSQQIPWAGKLRTRALAAEHETNARRAELREVELETIEQVKLAYYDLYYAQQALAITRQSRQLLGQMLEIAQARLAANLVSQQDVLRLESQAAVVDGQLVRFEQQVAEARAQLAQTLHISPDTPIEAIAELPPEDVPRDLDRLYEQAIAARPQLHAMLAEIEQGRQVLALAHLNYRPDLDLRFGWGAMTTDRATAPSADGIDNLAAGVGVNLPIYRKRLDAAVREAEARVVASARDYDQIRDETVRDVKRLFTRAASQQELERLFREAIIPPAEQALEISITDYRVGRADFVLMMDNWRELLELKIMHRQLQAELHQTLASLERIVGGSL